MDAAKMHERNSDATSTADAAGQYNDLLHLTHHCAALGFTAPQLTQVFIVCV